VLLRGVVVPAKDGGINKAEARLGADSCTAQDYQVCGGETRTRSYRTARTAQSRFLSSLSVSNTSASRYMFVSVAL